MAASETADNEKTFSFGRVMTLWMWAGVCEFALFPILWVGVVAASVAYDGRIFVIALNTALLVVFAGGCWPILYFVLRERPRSVTISSGGLAARLFWGRRVRLRWAEIAQRQEFGNRRRPQIRLLSADGRTAICLDGMMRGFEELAPLVREKTLNAAVGDTRRWFERLWFT